MRIDIAPLRMRRLSPRRSGVAPIVSAGGVAGAAAACGAASNFYFAPSRLPLRLREPVA